ncbi:hypothetical protein [Idiomarina sp. HP20-50]|uniref:hypothetical protein n=1 Tax=Idiomarina sp. HP20-50 TaxID=3070813 RepID=UPI00294B2DE5|nr:hypothetical protein [Idiomarina sp. HP20-50]MDV6317364.1 hypothetical protein [Idiomarina sp. HP20-50]
MSGTKAKLADDDDIWKLRYNSALGVRYHMARQSFYRRLQRFISGFSLALSTAAVASLFSNTVLGQVLASLVAILQAFDLVIDTRGSCELHNNLRRDYLRLEQELTQRIKPLTLSQLQKLADKLVSIETDEPPIKRWLLESCRRDADAFLGIKHPAQEQQKIRWCKELFKNIV